MIAEGIAAAEALIARSIAPIKVNIPDPRAVYFAVNGEIAGFDLAPSPRAHKPDTVAEVIALANRFAEGGGFPVVWYDADKVVLVIDDNAHRVSTATLALELSELFVRVAALNGSTWHDHKRFLRLLRVDLAGTLESDYLVNAVRKIVFATTDTRSAEIRGAKESLGREIQSKAEAGAEIAERVFELVCPVYRTPGETETFAVRCTLEVDPGEARLQLVPFPDEIQRVRQRAVASIGERLHAGLTEGIPAYQGKP